MVGIPTPGEQSTNTLLPLQWRTQTRLHGHTLLYYRDGYHIVYSQRQRKNVYKTPTHQSTPVRTAYHNSNCECLNKTEMKRDIQASRIYLLNQASSLSFDYSSSGMTYGVLLTFPFIRSEREGNYLSGSLKISIFKYRIQGYLILLEINKQIMIL